MRIITHFLSQQPGAKDFLRNASSCEVYFLLLQSVLHRTRRFMVDEASLCVAIKCITEVLRGTRTVGFDGLRSFCGSSVMGNLFYRECGIIVNNLYLSPDEFTEQGSKPLINTNTRHGHLENAAGLGDC